MEKEKLSETLSGMVGENSLSERTWNDYLDNSVVPFLPSEEEHRDGFLTKHANALKSFNGQLNHDVAQKVNEFKKSYKPETPTPSTEPKTQTQAQDEEKLNDFESRLSKFETAEAAKKLAKEKTAKLGDAKKLMQEQGASNETVLNLILPQLNIDGEISASDIAKKGKAAYDKAYSELYSESYVPSYNGGSSTIGKKSDKDAYMKHLKATGRITD